MFSQLILHSNGDGTWAPITPPAPQANAGAVHCAVATPTGLTIGATTGVYYSTNLGQAWTQPLSNVNSGAIRNMLALPTGEVWGFSFMGQVFAGNVNGSWNTQPVVSLPDAGFNSTAIDSAGISFGTAARVFVAFYPQQTINDMTVDDNAVIGWFAPGPTPQVTIESLPMKTTGGIAISGRVDSKTGQVDIYATAQPNQLLHAVWDGTQAGQATWTAMPAPGMLTSNFDPTTGRMLPSSIWVSSEGQVYTVGQGGKVFHYY
jgi:hypothetical protein